jgi:hypothetical protein
MKSFGERLIRYVLCAEDSELLESALTAAQVDVIATLRQYISVGANQPAALQAMQLGNALMTYVPNAGTSLANTFRLHCGGQLPQYQTPDDPALAELLKLSLDAFPVLLIPPSDDMPGSMGMGVLGMLINHPAHDSFCQAVLSDQNLKNLFPGVAEGINVTGDLATLASVQSMLTFSSGRGGSFQLAMLAGTLIMTAYDRFRLSDSSEVDDYLAAVREVYGQSRQLAAGKTIQVPAVIGLAKVQLPLGDEIKFSDSELRSPRSADGPFLTPSAGASMVLVTMVPLKILSKATWNPDGQSGRDPMKAFEQNHSKFESWGKDVERVINIPRYALLLASKGDPYPIAQHVSTSILDPLNPFPQQSWREQPVTPFTETVLDGEMVGRFKDWVERIKLYHPSNLDVAMRRILSAVGTRTDPLDGFIDAVLAWENMFSGTPETTMKVCGPISMLLERGDLTLRVELYKALQELYGKRSKIVHGGEQEPSSQEASKYRDRAVEVALEAMRRLYEFPELLKADGAAVRGRNILLGALNGTAEQYPFFLVGNDVY